MTENELPVWIKYAGDIFFLIAFFVILFFFKPDPEDFENSEEELPNPLEKVLVTDEPKEPENE